MDDDDLSVPRLLLSIRERPCSLRDLAGRFDVALEARGTSRRSSTDFLRMLEALSKAELITPWDRDAPDQVVSATPLLQAVQGALGFSLTDMARRHSHEKDLTRIQNLAKRVGHRLSPAVPYRDDVLESLQELGACLEAGCYSAVIGLCGRLLETTLKHHLLSRAGPDPSLDGMALGALLERSTVTANFAELKNVANVIKECRNAAVHSKKPCAPWPTAAKALMVLHATFDAINLLILERSGSDSDAPQARKGLR